MRAARRALADDRGARGGSDGRRPEIDAGASFQRAVLAYGCELLGHDTGRVGSTKPDHAPDRFVPEEQLPRGRPEALVRHQERNVTFSGRVDPVDGSARKRALALGLRAVSDLPGGDQRGRTQRKRDDDGEAGHRAAWKQHRGEQEEGDRTCVDAFEWGLVEVPAELLERDHGRRVGVRGLRRHAIEREQERRRRDRERDERR